jgi:hypothetical protein
MKKSNKKNKTKTLSTEKCSGTHLQIAVVSLFVVAVCVVYSPDGYGHERGVVPREGVREAATPGVPQEAAAVAAARCKEPLPRTEVEACHGAAAAVAVEGCAEHKAVLVAVGP